MVSDIDGTNINGIRELKASEYASPPTKLFYGRSDFKIELNKIVSSTHNLLNQTDSIKGR